MVAVACTVSGTERINDLLQAFGETFPEELGKRVKQVSFAICDSLRAATPKGKTKLKPGDNESMALYPAFPYPSIYGNHGKGPKLHRWYLFRHYGTPNSSVHPYYVYATKAKAQGVRGSKSEPATADEQIRELYKEHGGIQHVGLAKKSWNWIKQKIHCADAGDISWKMRAHDKRDPREFVNGIFQVVSGPS